MSAVSVEHLTKQFGDFAAVDDVSFEVPQSQLVAVLGPNGAGKTTTPLYPRPWRVDEMLELVDLTADASIRVGALSGGQRRRVDLAIGIIGRPDILFLDEPTTGLDPEARRRTWASVENLTSTGTTVVLTTHYIDEADHLADRVIVLAGGRIVTDTTPHELRAQGGPLHHPLPLSDPAVADDLPPGLAEGLDQSSHALVVRSTNMTATLRELVGWAERHHLDLGGLEVGPPTLEDAYLTAIGEPLTPEVPAHA